MTNFDIFLKKVADKQNERKQPITIDVVGFGEVEFLRPSTDELLKYIDAVSNSMVINSNEETTNTDMLKLHEASSKLVYMCCPYLQEKKLQETLSIDNPFDTPSEVFGATEVLNIASQIIEKLDGKKKIEEINDAVKN